MRATDELTQRARVHRPPWLLGLIASVIMLVLTLLLLETGLRFIGYGDPDERRDPFHGFAGAPPVYIISDEPDMGQLYVPRPSMDDITRAFPVKKPPGGYRVFAFGGSTTYGQPYGNEGGFPYFIEQELRASYPDRPIEVINCGVKGFGSSRVLQIVEEMVEYEPDLFVIYTGQNEYRDAKFHYWELHRSPLTSVLLSTLLKSRALYFLHERYLDLESLVFERRITSFGASLIETILAEQDLQKSFASYDYYTVPRIAIWHSEASAGNESANREKLKTVVKKILRHGYMTMSQEEVEANYQKNIARMIEVAKQHDIDVVLLEIASNPKERSLLSPDTIFLPEELAATFPKEESLVLYASGIDHLKRDEYQEAVTDLAEAQTLLGRYGRRTLQLFLGEAYEGLGFYNRAVTEYGRRSSPEKERLNAIIRTAGEMNDVPVLDAPALFSEHAGNGIVGYENYFVDSVHMSIDGYRLIAQALVKLLMENGTFPPSGINPDDVARLMETMEPDVTETVAAALGWVAFNQGQPERAMELGEQALDMNPDDIGAHVLLGYVYMKLGRPEDARHIREQLSELYASKPY